MNMRSVFLCLFFGVYLRGEVISSNYPDEIVELPRMPRPKINDSSLLYRAATSFVGVFYSEPEVPGQREFNLAACYVYGLGGKPKDPELASRFLLESALKNHADAMLFIGLLMVNLHGDELSELAHCIGFNQKTGPEYLRRAKELGAESAAMVLESFSSIKGISRLCEYAGSNRKIDSARYRILLRKMIQDRRPLNCYYVAEALLRPQTSILTKPVNFVLDGQGRRRFAFKLLSIALEHNINPAKKLLTSLKNEDRIYEAICEMMRKDIEEGMEINGLEIGDAGFQEAYIDGLYQRQTEVLGKVLSQEDCERFKESMSLRVRSLFYAFSKYFQCMNEILRLKGRANSNEMTKNLNNMVIFACNKDIFPVPSLESGVVVYNPHSILSFGRVASSIQPIEAERAFAMLMECSDDFKVGEEVLEANDIEEPTSQENIMHAVSRQLRFTSCVAVMFQNDLFSSKF